MALVSMGSAWFTMMGANAAPADGDPTRVAAQIVTGIGFLGALCGVWMWREAVVGAVIVLASNGLLYPLARWMDHRPHKPGHEKRSDF